MQFLTMSLMGGGLVLATAALRALFRNKVPPSYWLVLWGAALCRLLIPASFPSPLSVLNLSRRFAAQHAYALQALSPAPAAAPVFPAWGWAVLSGGIVLALYLAIAYLRAIRTFRTSLPAAHADIAPVLKEYPLRRTVSVRMSDRIASPVTYGVLRPVILLPSALRNADAGALRLVLAHEMTHIRRFDCLWKLVAAAALCVHWFNPAVWLLLHLFSRDLELSCDRAVVRRGGPESRKAYAMTLLCFAESKSAASPLFSHLSKHPIEERIKCIMTSRKYSVAGLTLASVMLLGTTSAFAAPAPETPAEPVSASYTSMKLANTDQAPPADGVESDKALATTFTITGKEGENPNIEYLADYDFQKKVLDDGTVQYTLKDGSVIQVQRAEDVK